LASIKFLRLIGRLSFGFIRLATGFFRWLFGRTFSKILVKIYYNIFRLKKSELAGKAINELTRNRLVYLFVLVLTIFLVFNNINGKNQAAAAGRGISQTVMANLVETEFGGQIEEELIEETIDLNRLAAKNELSLEDSAILDKPVEQIVSEEALENFVAFNNEGDLIFKPNSVNESGGFAPPRTEIIEYTIQPGDTVSSIAQHFNITTNTILWANDLSAYTLIRPGKTLTILPYSGLLYTVKKGDTVASLAKKYKIEEEKILEANRLEEGLKISQKIILPGANKIIEAPKITTTAKSGLNVISNLAKPSAAKPATGAWLWPTDGHRISQYFSWRHQGLDIANAVGTPLYATADGVIEISQGGWNGGYGNTILINHGNGQKTRYGHASKLLVSKGESVSQGQIIALMGSTGRSTGSHLHFEIIINGQRVNPLNYIK
jgi:murein DD-endopeptidase MepM/ murein hydrolase activator NlpD